MNGNGQLDLASTDRITESDSVFEKDGNAAWWAKQTTKTYNVDNSATPITTAIAKTRLNKFDDHGMNFGSYVQSESIAIDIFGNQTRQTVAVQRGTGYYGSEIRLVTATTDLPDSNSDVVQVSYNGVLQKSQNAQGFVSRSYYDALNRLVKQTDPRTDTSSTPRIGFVANSARTAWQQDSAGNQTNYTYETATGRLASVTDPLGKKVYTAYTTRGEAYRSWGDATYPVEYAFNTYGERVGMNTYRGGTGWNAATWPAAPGTADATTWAFDPATGTLTSKTDAQNRVVAYTYNTRGQLKTRQWARGVTTTYAYSATTAEQTGITYSDATPALSYTYNRLGQNLTVGDVTGTRTFNYNAWGQLTQEDLGAYVGTRSVAYQYDTTGNGTRGRLTLLGVGPTASPTSEYNISYGYDATGRMNQVWTFNYTYLANSNLLSGVADTQTAWTQSRTYEGNRDLLASIGTQWSGAAKATFAYTSDQLGRRTGVAKTGEMFTRYGATGLDTTWAYNDRSEVISEQTKLGGTNTPLTGRNDAHAFDNIGNRTTTTHNGNTSTYTANSLNQYTGKSNPGKVDVSGLAPAAASVTINGSGTGVTRHNDYYFAALDVTNLSNAVWTGLTVAATTGGSTQRFSFTPPAAEVLTYDLDGNLTSDGRWDYTYDAENRLVAMQTKLPLSPVIIPNADARRVEFVNDYLGRRVRKTVRAGYNGTTYTTVQSDTKNLYNGWNLLFEYRWNPSTSTFNINSAYIWGLDWSGSLQGAGGVGGLLHIRDFGTSTSLRVAYDGNGNVMSLINTATGTLAAAYEYEAFGNTLRSSGAAAASNPFRFSTKYTDTETGLIYYGLRYYSPTLGRFINRDPIEEKGGLHLYGFCSNNGVNRWDRLGMDASDEGGNVFQSYVINLNISGLWIPWVVRSAEDEDFVNAWAHTEVTESELMDAQMEAMMGAMDEFGLLVERTLARQAAQKTKQAGAAVIAKVDAAMTAMSNTMLHDGNVAGVQAVYNSIPAPSMNVSVGALSGSTAVADTTLSGASRFFDLQANWWQGGNTLILPTFTVTANPAGNAPQSDIIPAEGDSGTVDKSASGNTTGRWRVGPTVPKDHPNSTIVTDGKGGLRVWISPTEEALLSPYLSAEALAIWRAGVKVHEQVHIAQALSDGVNGLNSKTPANRILFYPPGTQSRYEIAAYSEQIRYLEQQLRGDSSNEVRAILRQTVRNSNAYKN